MKKNCIGVSYKSYWVSTLILLAIIGSTVSYCYGEEEERKTKWGFSILWGTGDVFYTQTDMKVYGFFPRMSFPLRKDWKYWDLEFEGNFFYYDIQKMHNVYFLGLSQNTVFKPVQERWGSLFLLIGGGSVMIAQEKDCSVALQKRHFWEISILQDLPMQVQGCSLISVEKPH